MKIAVIGAGSVGVSIAKELLLHGHEVIIIDESPEAIHVSEIPDADWALCDACSPSALEDAGLRECEAAVAATGDDKVNLVVSLLAKSEFAVPKVVARVNDPTNEWMFNSNWGVDVPTSTPRVMTALVEESISVGHAVRLFALNESAVGIYALVIPDDSPLVGRASFEIDWPSNLIISAVVRQGVPRREVEDLRGNDELLVVVGKADLNRIPELESLVAG